MSYFLAQGILAAGNGEGEDAIWMQMLVLVIVVALIGVGSIVKTQANKFKGQRRGRWTSYIWQNWRTKLVKALKGSRVGVLEATQAKAAIKEPVLFDTPDVSNQEKVRAESAGGKGKDLAGGMEMLELDFLLSIVDNIKGDDKNDVMMRKLNFDELIRREQLGEIDSNALKIYARDEGGLYGKDIQCEAIKELTVRTARKLNIVL
jgi:hypothetical protein